MLDAADALREAAYHWLEPTEQQPFLETRDALESALAIERFEQAHNTGLLSLDEAAELAPRAAALRAPRPRWRR
jgi:hypothetical protein